MLFRSACDGVSLVSNVQKGVSLDRDSLYWHYPHYHRTNPYSAVRKGDWKLIRFHEGDPLELYNLAEDASESKNVAEQNPEKVQALVKNLDAWLKSVDAQSMSPNPNYEPSKKKKK